MTRSRTWPCSTWCPERPGPRGEAGPAGPARPGRRWRCGTAGGRPCSAGSHCYAEAADQGSRAQDHLECSPGKTTSRTAGTDHAAAAVVVVAACTFAVVFSVVVAELTFVVALAAAAEPTFVVVSIAAAAVVVAPTFADLSAVVAAVDRSVVDISAAAEAGAVGWSRAAAAGCSWAVSTCSEVGGRSCCSQSWGGPVMWSEVAGQRSVLTDIVVVVVVVVVRGRLGVAAEAAEV